MSTSEELRTSIDAPSHVVGLFSRVGLALCGAAGTVLAASFIIYAGLSIAPGDPVAQLLGGRASDASRAAKRSELGLDDSLVIRYWDWLTSALHGDLGTSLTYRGSVADLVGSRLETTVMLVLMAAVIVVVAGVALGMVGGVYPKLRPAVSGTIGLGIAIPSFVSASALIGIFAVGLGWFPTYGTGDGILDQVWHLVLPAIALAISYASYVAQMSTAAFSEEASRDYVITSRGRGVPETVILRNHILRNASLPVLTASGLAVAGLVSGTVIVEQVFSIDGIGALLVESITGKDYSVVMVISIVIVIIFVVITTAIDMLQSILDPRTRRGV